jgi:hypothetical protein
MLFGAKRGASGSHSSKARRINWQPSSFRMSAAGPMKRQCEPASMLVTDTGSGAWSWPTRCCARAGRALTKELVRRRRPGRLPSVAAKSAEDEHRRRADWRWIERSAAQFAVARPWRASLSVVRIGPPPCICRRRRAGCEVERLNVQPLRGSTNARVIQCASSAGLIAPSTSTTVSQADCKDTARSVRPIKRNLPRTRVPDLTGLRKRTRSKP